MTPPVVLYACIHNSGRSVAAKVLTEHHGDGRVEVRSAGSEPGTAVNEAVSLVLAERGLSADGHVPSLLTYDGVQEADVVITMGCGETCPVAPGKRYEDWTVADPKGRPIEEVRLIVDDVERRVLALLASLPPAPTPPPPERLIVRRVRCPVGSDVLAGGRPQVRTPLWSAGRPCGAVAGWPLASTQRRALVGVRRRWPWVRATSRPARSSTEPVCRAGW